MKRTIQRMAQLTGGVLLLMLPAFGENITALAIGLAASVVLLAVGCESKF